MTVKRFIVFVGLIALVGAGVYAAAHAVCQHRAEYAGGLVFVGRPVNVFGTEYYRVYLWRSPDDTSPLPNAAVTIDGVAHALSVLTPEVFAGVEAPRNEGGDVDSAGARIQYRFENGRLTWFSLDTDSTGATTPVENNRYTLSIKSASGFTLPIRHNALTTHAGKPERSFLYFAQ